MRAMLTLALSLFSAASLACGITPSATQNLNIKGVYLDKKGSIVDPKRQSENELRRDDVNQYVDLLTSYADDYQKNGNKEQKACALDAINQWGKNSALLGNDVTRQGTLVRMWFAGSIGVSLLKLGVQENELSKEGRAWVEALASAVYDLVLAREKVGEAGRNNLYYWAGFSLGTLGQFLKNQQYIDKSKEIYLFSLDAISNDGLLKEEIRRGQRATLYHAFAAQAIFGMQLLHTSEEGSGAVGDREKLDRLINLLRSANKNPALLAERAGTKQMTITIPPWFALYQDLHGGKVDSLSLSNKKMCPSIPRLGGNICGLAAMEEDISLRN